MSSPAGITVVIPCFNDGHFLADSLTSVASQTLSPIEIIVVNDGSTNSRTLKILRDLKKPRVNIIDQENRGLAGARNTGFRSAVGKYVYFLDADDFISPQCLEKLHGLLEEHDGSVGATSKIQLFGGPNHGAVWGEPSNRYVIRIRNQWGAGMMLRKEAVKNSDLSYDESMRSGYEDWELNIRLAETGKKILFCPEALYHYRIRRKSLLGTTRKLHVDVVRYILAKHHKLYTSDSLLKTKRVHAPALVVYCNEHETADLETWLASQTFNDWSLEGNILALSESRYRLFYSSLNALGRLPPEALECTLMALECYARPRHCLIAVRQGCPSLFANSAQARSLEGPRYPVALVTRKDKTGVTTGAEEVMRDCNLMIEFVDQLLSSEWCWEQSLVRFSPNSIMTGFRGPESIRKELRSLGSRVLGETFQRGCVQLYDRVYYRVLCSDEAFTVRRKVKTALGAKAEHVVSSLVYGLFLTNPPIEGEGNSIGNHGQPSEVIAPLFASPADDRTHILVATAWLIEGGVEQIIFELCRLLDPSRFRVTIVTTLSSPQSWDGLARKTGASVYHLADFLKPADMVKGLLHIILNHRVDCMYIMNSEVAYRTAKTIKRIVPWLPIIDRIEAPDPGGGYPMISAKVGKGFIDLRTVSHDKLAQLMYQKYDLARDSVRVIYIGTNMARMQEISRNPRGRLHDICKVSLETPVVLFIGRFANQKRPEVFVRSVAKVFQLDPNCKAHFAMVGDGHLMASVKELISEHRLSDRLHLFGAHPNAAELLADATILMMPSAYEGVALVSYEAMALGIPQIFANVGGQNELITRETGILIDNGFGEETRYAQACLGLLSDPGHMERMAKAAKERIRIHFTAERAVNEYAGIFEQFAALSRKSAGEIPHLKPPHIEPLHASNL
jgi:glycosyltransferase involved in cell wall biosynthesis